MRFEKFLLDNYIASSEGEKVYKFFKDIHKAVASGDKNKEIITFTNSLLNTPDAESFYHFEPFHFDEVNELSYPPFSEFEEYVTNFIETTKTNWGVEYRDLLGEIPNFSLNNFYLDAPAYAFPYLFPVHFNLLKEIFDEFDIYLPLIPSTKKYKERCYYYIELCRSLYDFRQQYNLSPEELCVFIYGFAPKFISKNLEISELPQANKIWLVGAQGDDSAYHLPSLDNNSIFWWAGKENMNVGDIILIYELSPHSRIMYMARAFSDGYDDPFQYYPGKVWLSNLIKIPEVKYETLKKNKYFAEHGLVKAHMQGIGSGRELSNADYEELKNILSESKFDISTLPQTISYSLNLDVELNDEHDVEVHLLEPFLNKLGIEEKDYMRQMPLRMGRGERYYPDYVIHPKTTRGSEEGKFIWEAKYHILSQKDFEEAFYQAKSYALRLSARGLALVSYEGIWFSLSKDNYLIDKISKYTWQQLEDKDVFNKVSEVLRANMKK